MSAALALAATCFGAGSSEAEKVFESVYGEDVAAARATGTTNDDVELAAKLLDAARTVLNQPELMIILCEKAYELGAKARPGYQTAVDAMDLVAEKIPDRKLACQEKILEIFQLFYNKATMRERARAGAALIHKTLELADAKAARNDYAAEAALYRRALDAARTVGSLYRGMIEARLKLAVERSKLRKRIRKMEEQLKARPGDAAVRNKLILAYVIDRDNPAKAAKLLCDDADGFLLRCVPLAAKNMNDLDEEECQEVADWYESLAGEAESDIGKAAMFARTKTYCELLLKKVAPGKLTAIKVRLVLKKIEGDIEDLLNGPAALAKWDGLWWFLGPFAYAGFDNVYPAEKTGIIAKEYTARDGNTITWKPFPLKPDAVGGVSCEFRNQPAIVFFVFRTLHAKSARRLQLRFGSDDGVKAWFNGKPILSRPVTRRLDWDQETASILFKKGVNRLMIRINNSEGSQ
ncbi:MAG: hypothetical protein QF473_15755, partial [Planctomycetota bacterium]|nr:hypothetical protein [Planctomycetota bacterium]